MASANGRPLVEPRREKVVCLGKNQTDDNEHLGPSTINTFQQLQQLRKKLLLQQTTSATVLNTEELLKSDHDSDMYGDP